MKNIRIKKITVIASAIIGMIFLISVNSCKVSQAVADKSGAQLWGENCRRCHNAPDPNTFTDEHWVTIGMHMQTRALLTNKERDKIVAFLKSSN